MTALPKTLEIKYKKLLEKKIMAWWEHREYTAKLELIREIRKEMKEGLLL